MQMHKPKMHIRASQWGVSLYVGERPRWAGYGLGLGPDPEEGLIASAWRSKVEGLAEYAEELGGEVERWWRFKAASGAPGKGDDGFGRWHVIRSLDGPGTTGQNLRTPTGRLKTFGSREKAEAAAKKANVGITAEKDYARFDPQLATALTAGGKEG